MTAPAPVEVAALVGGDDYDVHLYCCRPDRAYCGRLLAGPTLAATAVVMCVPCLEADVRGDYCGAWRCRYVQAWREWRARREFRRRGRGGAS